MTEYQFAATSATYYYLNPRIPEAAEARQRFQAKYKDNPPLTISKSPYKIVKQEKRRNIYPLKTIMDQNLQSYKSVRFTVEATITGINMHKDWYYISCHECNRPTKVHEDSYSCLDHGPQSGPFYRYKFKGYITDDTVTVPMTFFSPAANQVTQHSCTELVEKYSPADPKKIPPEILQAQRKQGIFQFHLNTFGKLTDLALDAVYDIRDQQQPSETSSSNSITTPQPTKGKQMQETSPTSPSRTISITKADAHSTTQRELPTKKVLFRQECADPKKHKES